VCHWHMLLVLPHLLLLPTVAVHVHQSCCCAGNGDSSSAAPAAHPTPSRHSADPPAFGGSSFASSGTSFGFSASAGAAAFSATFGGASAGSASATAEDRGKRGATAGHSSNGRSNAGKNRVKAKAATAAGPPATAATARADRPTTPFTFSGADFLAGKWLQLVLPLVSTHFADCACAVRQCSFICCVLPGALRHGTTKPTGLSIVITDCFNNKVI